MDEKKRLLAEQLKLISSLIASVEDKVIGQDELERIDEDTISFVINTLNHLNIDIIRNKILLKVLPLKV